MPCAEAMASGTLLIASDFSGTTAFADSTNSLPVQCKVIDAAKGCEPDVEVSFFYLRSVWAIPLTACFFMIQGLAWRLRWTHDHGLEARALGTKGARDIRERFGMARVAELWAEEGRRGLGRFKTKREDTRLLDVD